MTTTLTPGPTTTTSLAWVVGDYRHTSRCIRRHHHTPPADPHATTRLHHHRLHAFEIVTLADPLLARLLVAEDVLLALICARKNRGRRHRRLLVRLAAVRTRIHQACRG
jgi:hypothetical protein